MPVAAPANSTASQDQARAGRIDLILRQIDTLPTLPAVAVRLLQLTTSDESDTRQVIEVVKADPALTANILSMCRRAELGVRSESLTIDKAVLLLGFTAVRNAVLSLKVLEVFKGHEDKSQGPKCKGQGPRPEGWERHRAAGDGLHGEDASAPLAPGPSALGPSSFDRVGFWRHSLAVAIAAELIVSAHPDHHDLGSGDAFVCGLLHDVGKLALDYALPRSYDRIVELVEINQGNIAEFERLVIGIDHHTAGKRLAEQWQLPHMIQDCIWLHGSPFHVLPSLPHRRMIGLVRLADLLARSCHLGYSGNYAIDDESAALIGKLDLDAERVAAIAGRLHTEVERREHLLGFATAPTQQVFLESIQRANQTLGRLNSALERRGRAASQQAQMLDAITAFHAAAVPGRSLTDVLTLVGECAAAALGEGYWAIVLQPTMDDRWLLCEFDATGHEPRSRPIDAPIDAPDLASIQVGSPLSLSTATLMPWINEQLTRKGQPAEEGSDANDAPTTPLRLLPLGCGWGTAAVLIHDRPALPPWRQLAALTHTWGAAIAAVAQHEGARRLSEQLAEANQALADAQDRLLQNESINRLGEMAAGAAHEMNNPLAIIAGRAQLLVKSLKHDTAEQKAARVIDEQARRLSDLITSLRLWAEPLQPHPEPIDPSVMLSDTVSRFMERLPQRHVPIYLQLKNDLPLVRVDGAMISAAVQELLQNAVQAQPRSAVHVVGRINPVERSLVIQVMDDGVGMDAHTLSHAMDPFFSSKPAGRLIGMGLTRARQLVTAHDGRLQLRSSPGEGTIATVMLPLDSAA